MCHDRVARVVQSHEVELNMKMPVSSEVLRSITPYSAICWIPQQHMMGSRQNQNFWRLSEAAVLRTQHGMITVLKFVSDMGGFHLYLSELAFSNQF